MADKYIRFNYAQAKRVLALINGYMEFGKVGAGDVLDLNSIAAQLEEVVNE